MTSVLSEGYYKFIKYEDTCYIYNFSLKPFGIFPQNKFFLFTILIFFNTSIKYIWTDDFSLYDNGYFNVEKCVDFKYNNFINLNNSQSAQKDISKFDKNPEKNIIIGKEKFHGIFFKDCLVRYNNTYYYLRDNDTSIDNTILQNIFTGLVNYNVPLIECINYFLPNNDINQFKNEYINFAKINYSGIFRDAGLGNPIYIDKRDNLFTVNKIIDNNVIITHKLSKIIRTSLNIDYYYPNIASINPDIIENYSPDIRYNIIYKIIYEDREININNIFCVNYVVKYEGNLYKLLHIDPAYFLLQIINNIGLARTIYIDILDIDKLESYNIHFDDYIDKEKKKFKKNNFEKGDYVKKTSDASKIFIIDDIRSIGPTNYYKLTNTEGTKYKDWLQKTDLVKAVISSENAAESIKNTREITWYDRLMMSKLTPPPTNITQIKSFLGTGSIPFFPVGTLVQMRKDKRRFYVKNIEYSHKVPTYYFDEKGTKYPASELELYNVTKIELNKQYAKDL
jgi:hypothetical protein